MNEQSVGERIAALRAERGMTREQLGEAIGRSASEVAAVESGALLLDISEVALIGEVLGVRLAEVLGVERHPARELADRVMREPVDGGDRPAVRRPVAGQPAC